MTGAYGILQRCMVLLQSVAMALVLLVPAHAFAYFDIVGLYQQKVKSFEAVYFLEEDQEWRRDRRVFEFFFSADRILEKEQDDETLPGYTNMSGGLIFNVRPGKGGDIQVSVFNLWSGNQMFTDDVEVWEALHGGRITFADWLELSLGGYWRSGYFPGDDYGSKKKGSFFMELNSPFLFLRSSYVIGMRKSNELERWDLRFDYDHFRWVDSIGVGLVQYDLGKKRTLFGAGFTRLGFPKFRFLSGEVKASGDGLAWAKVGVDILLQTGEDFNLTRRGHFSTSFGLQALYSYVSPDGASLFGSPDITSAHGATLRVSMQVPAKWVLLALTTILAGYTGSAEDQRRASEMAANVAREPRDIMFCRVEFEYTYNAPQTFLFPVPDIMDRHRLFLSLGFMY